MPLAQLHSAHLPQTLAFQGNTQKLILVQHSRIRMAG